MCTMTGRIYARPQFAIATPELISVVAHHIHVHLWVPKQQDFHKQMTQTFKGDFET